VAYQLHILDVIAAQNTGQPHPRGWRSDHCRWVLGALCRDPHERWADGVVRTLPSAIECADRVAYAFYQMRDAKLIQD
jgi:hypothetical protein